MAKKAKTTRQKRTNKPLAASQPDSPPPRRKPFWANPWFILGAIVLVLSVTFTLMNNSYVPIKFIGASLKINLPLLILGCALLGAAIEFFIVLGPLSDSREENRRLKQQIRELKS